MTVFGPGLKRCKFSKGYKTLAHGLHVGSMARRGFAVIWVICRLIRYFRIKNVLSEVQRETISLGNTGRCGFDEHVFRDSLNPIPYIQRLIHPLVFNINPNIHLKYYNML